jgi:ABC-2 type transport system ATP-binding protein
VSIILKIDNLTKVYANGEVKAVDDLSIEIKPGEIFGFLGPNGAGKSTTIKCLTGILPFDSGNINVCGYDLIEDPIKAKMSIGYVPDSYVVYDKLTGNEYLNFISDVYKVSTEDRKRLADRYVEMFELTAAINKPIKSYSHGMKQKISVIGALIHSPKLWVLDEPLTGLDPKSAYDLKVLMREHADQGNTVFFSSHVLEVVEKVCDRVAIIDKGKLISVCTLKELKEKRADLSLEEFFLSITKE